MRPGPSAPPLPTARPGFVPPATHARADMSRHGHRTSLPWALARRACLVRAHGHDALRACAVSTPGAHAPRSPPYGSAALRDSDP
ncbi:hypothetical protein Y09_0324 [Brachybacterium sp. SW0106-09]|nr:hypothetical protein Y09_0324 [Brachybacterium sp. SW0106-09]